MTHRLDFKTSLAIGSIVMFSLSLAACTDSNDKPVFATSSAASPSDEKGPQPTLSATASDEPEGKDESPFTEILSQAPSGSQYAEVDITADGKPELLLKTPDVNDERGTWPVVDAYDSEGSKYAASVTGNDGFFYGSGSAGQSRTMLQTTADNTGLLYSTWSGTAPEVNTQLWTVEGNSLVASGKAWDYSWKGDGSGIQDEAPEDLKANAVDIDWKDINGSSEGQEQQAQQSNSGRSKADFPYFTSGQTGTAPDPRQPNTTSPEFGRAVYNAFIDHWISTGDAQPQLQVASPVTGQTYSMSCIDQGMPYDFVLCTGGNNAKVYIYRPIDASVTKPMNLQYG